MRLKRRLSECARKAAKDAAALFLAMKRKETPIFAKLLIGIVVCYALSPIDLIPDFVPVIGLLDDALLLPLIIAAAVKFVPPSVMADCRRQAIGIWSESKPKKYLCALPVVLIWLAIVAGIIGAFLKR
jgi:uncharacterized membrane protein YkvA (DUF1232 family)